MKILCTGNPEHRGIAQAVRALWPDATFVSRGSGFDLTTEDALFRFKDLLKTHDVFINNAQVSPGTQEKLFKYVCDAWTHGHVFNIGSVLEFKKWEWIDLETAKEKRQLRDLSLEMSSEHFRTTHLIAGSFQDKSDPDPRKLHPINFAHTIKWILEHDCHIPLMYVDKLTDERIAEWLAKKT